MSTNNLDSLKELNDTEFAILFIDNIYKSLKRFDKPDITTSSLLLLYLSVVNSLKKYKEVAEETEHKILYSEEIDSIIKRSELYLQKVAEDESKSLYVEQDIDTLTDLVKGVLLMLKKDLVELPKYSYLKK